MTFEEMKRIAPALRKDLSEVLRKHGLEPGESKLTLNQGASITLKLTAGCPDDKGEAREPARANWNAHAPCEGLKQEWLDETFMSGGTQYRIAGIYPKRRKYKVLGISAAGNRMLFSTNSIKGVLSERAAR